MTEDEDRPPDWMTFLTKHCGLYIPGVYSNPYNDSRPLTATAVVGREKCACNEATNQQCVYHAFKADASFRSQ